MRKIERINGEILKNLVSCVGSSDCEELMGVNTRNNRGGFMGFLTLKLNSPKNLVYGKKF